MCLTAVEHLEDELDNTPPDPTILFTVLYGIYPCNFTAFLKDAVGYLREKRWQNPVGDGGIGLNSAMVRERSHVSRSPLTPHLRGYSEADLLHFYLLTADHSLAHPDAESVHFRSFN